MSADDDNHIPTLTDIITAGDADMKGHFEKSLLTDEDDDETENAVEVDTGENEEDRLGFESDEREPTLDMEGLSDMAFEDERDQDFEPQSELDAEALQQTIHQLVDDTLEAVMPVLEDQLRDRLTETLQALADKQRRR